MLYEACEHKEEWLTPNRPSWNIKEKKTKVAMYTTIYNDTFQVH